MIRNLINEQLATVTNCESEPIHIPGSIQPHGFLVGITSADYSIRYCSQNCEQYFHLPLKEILGKTLSCFFSEKDIAAFETHHSRHVNHEREVARPFVFTLEEKAYHTTAYQTDWGMVVEFEPMVKEKSESHDFYFQANRFAYHTERNDNLINLCQDIADETRKITGLDRVMIYRFDKAYNGEVISESKIDGLESFLGLHYPQSDIPVQARELYLSNLIRMIADVTYVPVPIFALDEGTAIAPNLDLSMSFLRSVSPIHIQYLKNMGVGASFSISLIRNGKLWGLISCHHTTPRHIPYHTRMAAHLQGIFLSSQIEVRQMADEFELSKKIDKRLHELQVVLANDENFLLQPEGLERLKKLINADGILLYVQDKIYKEGSVPDDRVIRMLCEWLSIHMEEERFHTSRFIDHFPHPEVITDELCGMVCLSMGKVSGNYIVWTRKEMATTIEWAGDPRKAVGTNKETNSLTPRKSFEAFKESVKFQSKEWLKAEVDAATAICSAIQNQLHLTDLKEEKIKYLSLNEKLQKANDELANMNWISTHDLKEPIRKIQMYASMILEKQGDQIPESAKITIGNMKSSALRMRMLIDDLLSYSRIMTEENRSVPVYLTPLLEEVIADLKESIEAKGALIEVAPLPAINGNPLHLHQLFVNLLGNALKYARKELPPVVKISYELISGEALKEIQDTRAQHYHKITITDNGIGFDPMYKLEIFKVFQRLHNKSQYSGSGIGLAICKKIAEAHHGFIEADGEEGNGATFTLGFPKVEELPST